MENYPNLFSSITTPQNSNDLHLLNMVNSHALDHDHDHHPKPNNGYMGLIASMELPRSDISNEIYEAKPDQMKKMKNKDEKKSRNPKYAFQTRSQVDILDDGYRWRKYGQKAVKNNKFPRSYYRCTHQGCNVKKQIQRLSKDEGVVVTTYDGMHSHPILKSTDNFEHILTQMQIYNAF